MRRTSRGLAHLLALVVSVALLGLSVPVSAEGLGAPGPDRSLYTPPFTLSFPLDGSFGFSDSFGAIRDGGSRLHQGNDISAPNTTRVLAAAGGVISRIGVGETAGLYVEISHADGWRTRYLHLNNEEPPPPPPPVVVESAAVEPVTEESAPEVSAASGATPEEPPAPEYVPGYGIPPWIAVGTTVSAGDVIGYVGTSGNAAFTAPHLHFEVRTPDGIPVNPHPLLTGRADASTLYVLPEITDEPVTSAMDVIGHVDPSGGFNTGVFVYDNVAYLGTFGTEDACPATGIRRYDVSDPSQLIELPPISDDLEGTSSGSIWAGAISTDAFTGTLAIIAHQPCSSDDRQVFGGLALYDVTDSALPELLGYFETGTGTAGVANFDVWIRGGAVYAVASSPNSLLDHRDGVGDVQIIDVTDPTEPVLVSDWDFRRDASETLRDVVIADGDPREFHAQGVTIDPNGERVFVAHWNAGTIIVDIVDPEEPAFVDRIAPFGHQEGMASSVAFDGELGVLVVNHQDIDPLDDVDRAASWGNSVVFDTTKPGYPLLASPYSIPDALPDEDGRLALGGLFSTQDAVISDHYLYAAWLSGGLRVVDLVDPEAPVEIASFMPPTRVDPQRSISSPNGNIAMPLAWSVHVVDDLIYVVDLNTGLWILRLFEPPTNAEVARMEQLARAAN
jgi:hypothetical protein